MLFLFFTSYFDIIIPESLCYDIELIRCGFMDCGQLRGHLIGLMLLRDVLTCWLQAVTRDMTVFLFRTVTGIVHYPMNVLLKTDLWKCVDYWITLMECSIIIIIVVVVVILTWLMWNDVAIERDFAIFIPVVLQFLCTKIFVLLAWLWHEVKISWLSCL